MGTVLILSKCTLLLLWMAREDVGREKRKNRTKKGSRREKDKKKRVKEKNWKIDQQEPESKISKTSRSKSISAGGLLSVS